MQDILSELEVITPDNIGIIIENIVWEFDISYIDAIVHYAEKNELDMEQLAIMVSNNPKLVSILQEEAEVLHFLPKQARLPS